MKRIQFPKRLETHMSWAVTKDGYITNGHIAIKKELGRNVDDLQLKSISLAKIIDGRQASENSLTKTPIIWSEGCFDTRIFHFNGVHVGIAEDYVELAERITQGGEEVTFHTFGEDSPVTEPIGIFVNAEFVGVVMPTRLSYKVIAINVEAF